MASNHNKRKSLTCYIHQTSPMKKKHINFRIQSSENSNLRRAVCFKTNSCQEFQTLETSGQAVTLRNVREIIPDNPNFAEIIFDDHSSIEQIAPGSMAFDRMETKLPPRQTVQEIAQSSWDAMDNNVTTKGVVCHNREVVTRGGFQLLEATFGDTTGQMPISVWSNSIEIFLKNEEACFELKNIGVKERNGVLTLTTNSNTIITIINLDKKHKSVHEKLRKASLKQMESVQGVIQLVKDFTCGSKCKICQRLVPHALTSNKFRCNPCKSIQIADSVSKTVVLGIDSLFLVLNSEVWTGTVFEEEVLADFLLGKKVDVSHIK
eukprot:TCONS_00030327-protein